MENEENITKIHSKNKRKNNPWIKTKGTFFLEKSLFPRDF